MAWALFGWALLAVGLALVGPARLALWPGLGVLLAIAGVAALNADLYAFFFRHGGARFASIAAALHVAYLLYSSLVFACLWVSQQLRGSLRRPR